MNEERKKAVLRWLYNNCGHKWFVPAVVDPVSNKAGNPPCNLSPPEILSVFETLRKEEYILPVVNPYGRSAFVLNEMKEQEWLAKIENTAPTKEKMVGDFAKHGVKYFAAQFGAGMIGGAVSWFVAKVFGG
jgi:hypothetical protein